MTTPLENYRQFEFTRFVYQEQQKPEKKAEQEAETDKNKPKEEAGKPEEPMELTDRVGKFNEETDELAKKAGIETDKLNDLQRDHAKELDKANGKRKKITEALDQKLDSITTKYTSEAKKLITKLGGKEPAPTTEPAAAETAQAETKTAETEEEKQNDPKVALINALYLDPMFRQEMAKILPPEANASPEAFREAMGKGKIGEAITKCLENPILKKGLTEKGIDYALTIDGQKAIGAAFKEVYVGTGVENAKRDVTEVNLINGLEGVKVGEDTMSFKEVFGEELAVALSIKLDIKEIKEEGKGKGKEKGKGESKISIGGKDLTKADAVKELIDNHLPQKIKELYKELQTAKEGPDRIAILKQLKEEGNTEAMTAERMVQVAEMLKSPDAIKGLKDMGPMELISTLIQLWSTIDQALKSKPQDFDTIGDMIKDGAQGKNPMESMREAENTYKEKINAMTDPNELLSLYANPKGREATIKFGETPYRGTMKKAVQERMEGALDIKITKIEPEKGGTSTKISGEKDGKEYEISINKDGQMTKEEIVAVVDNSGEIRRAETQLSAKQTELTELKKDEKKNAEGITKVGGEITKIEDNIKDLEAENGKGDRKKIGEGTPDQMYDALAQKLVNTKGPEPTEKPEAAENEVAANKEPAKAPAPEAKAAEKPAATTETAKGEAPSTTTPPSGISIEA